MCYTVKMKKIDTRKLNLKAQQQNRYLAIRLRKKGMSNISVAEAIGVNSYSVKRWWTIYLTKGYEGLTLKTRGVKLGNNRKLNLKQTESLKKTLIEKTPDQVDLNFSLWTRNAIQILVKKMWGIVISIRTAGRYMKRLGFTPQKPIKRAYEQNPMTVSKWLDEDYPEIAKQAKEKNAEIHWLDETGLSSYSNYLRGYAPKGSTPIVRMKAKRLNINIISSISKLGKMRFMTYTAPFNTASLIKFTARLCNDTNKKLFIILDNLAVHHSKIFMNWIKNRRDQIKVFYLPSYSPELNPDERLNRDLKTHFHSGPLVKHKNELKNKVVSYLKSIQKMPKRIKNYFNSNFVKYAA